MRYINNFFLVVVLFFISIGNINGQDKTKTHTVVTGETVRAIAEKYSITPYDLIKVNPDLKDPPNVGSVLIIPISNNNNLGILEEAKELPKKEEGERPTSHVVKAKETVFSLAKRYNVTMDNLFDSNPSLVEGLKIGMKLRIPEATLFRDNQAKKDTSKYIMHIISPKETRWGICHKYSITDEQLMDANPVVVQKMNIGDTLWIPKSTIKIEEKEDDISKNYTYYEVKPKDTVYGISKKFNISIIELKNENSIIDKEGLQIGMVLKIPKAIRPAYDTTKVDVLTFTNLPNDSVLTNNEKIEELDKLEFPKVIDVVLMLPFYLNKNGDLLHDITSPKSKVQNEEDVEEEDLFYSRSAIALEFYNGALFAIDSLKKMGLSVRLRVYDTQKNIDVVKQIMDENDFSEVDVVIGPLYTKNVEYVADRLKYDNILVVSPLSKKLDIDNRFNLIQAMPTSYTTKNMVLKEIVSEKNDSTNIVVFGGSIDSLTAVFLKTRLESELESSNKGGSNIVNLYIAKDNLVDRESVFKMLKPDKENVVLIASNSNVLATDVITAFNQKIDSLPGKAYIISHPKILKQLEGSYLNAVSLSYPTDYFVHNDNPKVLKFNSEFKSKYKYFPSTFSYRGFDITYEMLLSLGRNSNLEVGIMHESRDGIQGKFEFVHKPFGGYYNKGVFMIQYRDWKLEDVTNN